MSSRLQILERIRSIRQEERELPNELPLRMLPDDEIQERFIVSCSLTGTGIHLFASTEEAVHFFLSKTDSAKSYIGPDLPGHGPTMDHEKIECALLKGQFGVGENNAVWLPESSMGHRVMPFVCLHLYLILHAEALVADMHEAYHQEMVFAEGFGAFIAGPSKTADIEQSLVIGAHGPLSLNILLITNH